MRTGFKYTVKYVKKRNTSAGEVTEFSVGEKMRGTDKFANHHCIVWGDIDLHDNEKIVIDSIEAVDVREYKDKLYHDITVKVHKIDATDHPVADPSGDDEKLPFDI